MHRRRLGGLSIDFRTQQSEAAAIHKDIQRAYKIINDAKIKYIKTKLKAKSKKHAENMDLLFADLADYACKVEIQDYYGGGYISRKEYERLVDLWDEREQYAKDGALYRDRVVEMLEKAIEHIGDGYEDFLYDAEMTARENKRNQQGRFPNQEDNKK